MSHRNFLIDLITALDKAGFTNILRRGYEGTTALKDVGIEALVDEILDIDEVVALNVELADVGKGNLLLLCANDPWETIMDAGYANDEMERRVNAVLRPVEDKYLP